MECKISVKAGINIIYVPTDYPTIQEAINSATEGDTIFVLSGRTYYENLVVNKTVSLIGENRETTIIDGNRTKNVIYITVDNASIRGFTIKRSGTFPGNSGVSLDHSSGSDISHNIITNNYDGISFYYSSNNMISDNTISSNSYNGVSFYYSSNNMISGNTIKNNNSGMYLALYSSNNAIHCNNFNNTCQVWADSTNVWDDGNEGNYWSDYTRQDLNGDGIGDYPYGIDVNNQDNHPLMGMFSDFSVTLEGETYHVTTICNSTISDFRFEIGSETGNKIIRFNATGKDGTIGFCRVMIPTELMNYPYIVLVGMEEIVPTLLDVSNETHVYRYFTYIHNSYTTTIISSKTSYLYNELLDKYVKLNATFYDLLGNYSVLLGSYGILLDNYSQLQKSYLELNSSYQNLLVGYSENVCNIQNLMYIFAATTAIFIMTTIYLSKHAHAGKTKVFEDKK